MQKKIMEKRQFSYVRRSLMAASVPLFIRKSSHISFRVITMYEIFFHKLFIFEQYFVIKIIYLPKPKLIFVIIFLVLSLSRVLHLVLDIEENSCGPKNFRSADLAA